MDLGLLHEFESLTMKKARISSGGQISVPAPVRRRWGADWVQIIDHGDHLVVRPIDEDPITTVRGSLKIDSGRTLDDVRGQGRAEDAAAEERRSR